MTKEFAKPYDALFTSHIHLTPRLPPVPYFDYEVWKVLREAIFGIYVIQNWL